MKHPLSNVAASVRQRLLNLAQKRGEEFQSLLTAIPETTPAAFTPRFTADQTKAKQWKAFLVRARVAKEPPAFEVLLALVADFLRPAVDAARTGTELRSTWPAGGPWTNR